MIRKIACLITIFCVGLESTSIFGMYLRTKTSTRRSPLRKEQVQKEESMVSSRSIWYALGYSESVLSTVYTQRQAIDLVKHYIETDIFGDEVGNLEFPTPSAKVDALRKKVDILPGNIDYNDVIFTRACDELIKEINNTKRTQKKREKDEAIDKAIVRFKARLSSSDNIYKDAIRLMGPNNRALVSIALQQECKECMEEQFGKDKYEQLVVESRRRAPMDEERKSAFEERKKQLARMISSKRGDSKVMVDEAAEQGD